jgi:2-amino-4-hydroxy-6-hydroxymethyldihydropteridine diphosphokinase
LGSNVGDRLANLKKAVELLDSSDGISVEDASSVYDTDPIGPEQANFLNAVVRVESSLSAQDLLARLKEIEAEIGRRERGRWGPREIDLDVLLFGDEVIEDLDLVVPHTEIANRAFVLVPLLDIDPAIEVPGLGPVADLATAAGTNGVRLTAHSLR